MSSNPYLVRRWWLLPLIFVVIAGSIGVNLGEPVPMVLGGLAGLVLPGIDRWLPAVLVNGVLVGSYFVIGGQNGPIFFTVIAAAFLAAFRGRVREWLPYVVGSGVLLWIGLVVRGVRTDDVVVGAWQGFGIGAAVAAATAIATSVRSRGVARAERAQRAAAAEQLRMAQELHDGVGHGLSVIAMQAGVALHVLERDPSGTRRHLEAIRATAKESLEALRSELAVMSGEPAPRRPVPGIEDIPALVERVRGAGLQVSVTGAADPLPAEHGEVVYAVVQESLTNVLRHAGAARAEVRLERAPDRLRVTVADDGGGGADSTPGLGIAGMRARVERLGGTLQAGPGVAGFAVRAELPLGGEG